MKIITISGKINSGKDTIADLLGVRFKAEGYSFVIRSFADPLKQEIWESFLKSSNIPIDVLYRRSSKEVYRTLIQEWGTLRRLEDPDYWVKRINIPERVNYAIFPDTRHFNEINHFQGALTIRVERESSLDNSHSSETELDNYAFDKVILNDGTLNQLESLVSSIELTKYDSKIYKASEF